VNAPGKFSAAVLLVLMTGPATGAPVMGDASSAWRGYSLEAVSEPGIPIPFESCFRQAAEAHDLPLSLLVAVARGESNFDPDAVSSANARGLMQIQWPGTGRHLGFRRVADLHDPCRNVDGGARYLRELLRRYDGDLHLALAAYNYGPGRISGTGNIPEGAEWYSAYIYRHLQYVLDAGAAAGPAPREWSADRQMELAVFGAPYRAEAFVRTLAGSAPEVRLDWFRQDVGRFRVVMLFASQAERRAGLRRLAAAGFPLPEGRADG